MGKWNDLKGFYAAVPTQKNKLAIVHQANVIKVCRNEQSARNFIEKHKKREVCCEVAYVATQNITHIEIASLV